MKKKIIVTIIIVLLLALPVVLLKSLFSLLQSPLAVNKLAAFAQPFTGIYLHLDDIYLNRQLGGHISGLQIKEMKENGSTIYLSRADINGHVSRWFKITIEKLVLTEPKFSFFLKEEKSETNPFEFLKKLPPVHLLEIKNGQVDLKADSTAYSMPGLNATISNFDPEGRGHLSGKSGLDITDKSFAVNGSLEAQLDFSSFSPAPSASGLFQISFDKSSWGDIKLDSGAFSSGLKLNGDIFSLEGAKAAVGKMTRGEGKGQLFAKNIQARFNAAYNQKTSGFSLTSLEFSGTDIGLLKGDVSASFDPLLWNASLHAASLDIAKVFAFAKPLLPDHYGGWSFKGKSGLDVESQGKRENDTVIWNAKAMINLREGGFASPDGSRAAEKINSKMELKFDAPGNGRKGIFNVDMDCAVGELLWGTYYQDFKGRKAKISSRGTFSQKPFALSLHGTGDFFQTGDYKFSTEMSGEKTILSLTAGRISLGRLFNTAVQNYISQNYPGIKDLKIEGDSDLKLTARLSPKQKLMEGTLALRGGAIHSPSNDLTLTGLNISLPYDIDLAGNTITSSSGNHKGTVAFDMCKKGNMLISKFATPVIFSGNRFIMPDPVTVAIFGGEVNLAGFRAENLLRPEMFVETGLRIKHLSLEQLAGKDASVPLSGMIDGNLPSITFKNGKWTVGGEVTARSFGGQIKIENIFAGRLFSAAQYFGADVRFDHIDLEKLTSSIKVGRITGLVKGSLKNFSMEYGQPSSFDLEITTDTSRNVPKLISVDAINDLSIVSTGSGAISAILSSGINQFFKDYPYSKIGIRCTLREDTFKLRGLIHDAGKEYLVRKALFRGVDIINQNPDNYISFKDMAERVGRINKSKKETKNVP